MRTLRFIALTIVAILALAAAAEAACLTTDMNNTSWFAYIKFTGGWSRCTVNIGSNGAVCCGTMRSVWFISTGYLCERFPPRSGSASHV